MRPPIVPFDSGGVRSYNKGFRIGPDPVRGAGKPCAAGWGGRRPVEKSIRVVGARENNLKSVNVNLRHRCMHVISGVSGSGKSSLAVDTLFAEGQRRYIESLSTYARQFLERIRRAEVERIEGLPPAILIERSNPVTSSRSTVGTATEIHDYLRLLFARVGRVFCPECDLEISLQTVERVTDWALSQKSGARMMVLFRSEVDGDPSECAARWKRAGFSRALIEDQLVDFSQGPPPGGWPSGPVWIVVDRLTVRPDARSRVSDSVETAFREGADFVGIWVEGNGVRSFSGEYGCPKCGTRYQKPSPVLFSFNSPRGACPGCHGFGNQLRFLPDLIVPDGTKTLREGAIDPWYRSTYRPLQRRLVEAAPRAGVRLDVPYETLTREEQDAVLHGNEHVRGVIPFLDRLYKKRYKMHIRFFLKRYLRPVTCEACGGGRLRPEALAVRIGGLNIAEFTALPVADSLVCQPGDQMFATGFYPVAVDIDDDQPQAPAAITLPSNHPNPFNPSTNISFSVFEPSIVKLNVYDVLGREVTAEQAYFTSGNHEFYWDGSNKSSGVYFFTIQIGNEIYRGSMTLLK